MFELLIEFYSVFTLIRCPYNVYYGACRHGRNTAVESMCNVMMMVSGKYMVYYVLLYTFILVSRIASAWPVYQGVTWYE